MPSFLRGRKSKPKSGPSNPSTSSSSKAPPEKKLSDDEEVHAAIESANLVVNRKAESDSQGKAGKIENSTNDHSSRIAKTAQSIYTDGNIIYQGHSDALKASANKIADIVQSTPQIHTILNGEWGDASTVLLNALDALVPIHPFIGVAVTAFKLIVNLELTRRDNDKKIIALELQMHDMMSVLLELRYVRDPKQPAPDGKTVAGRLQGIMLEIAENIKECGNACDNYAKKSVLVKVIKGSIYELNFAAYSSAFSDRRKEVKFALAMHTTLGVDAANRTLEGLRDTLLSVVGKVDIITIFRMIDSPRDKEIMKLIQDNGGPAKCMDNQAVMQKLSALSGSKDQIIDADSLASLKSELKMDVREELEKNMKQFERKLDLQSKQIVKEIGGIVEREGDRVITAVVSGPHDRIIDPDLYNIWKDMGWKGSVKARHFVIALHDYFVEKYRTLPPDDDDRRALQFIKVLHAQPIVEVFDDDSTGFVSVSEANRFTTSRPKDWSLPRWLAFWAAGWHTVMCNYHGKIRAIIQDMFHILETVHPANRGPIDAYLLRPALRDVELLLRSFNLKGYETLQGFKAYFDAKMSSYVKSEESRMESNLQTAVYEIDASDTLGLITGLGRLERYLFPMLYLLLKQHLKLIKASTQIVLDRNEFVIPMQSLAEVVKAVRERFVDIVAIFKHQNLDVSSQLQRFSFGLFQYLHDSKGYENESEDDTFYDDSYSDQKSTDFQEFDTNILKYKARDEFDYAAYELPVPLMAIVSESEVQVLSGIWSGHFRSFEIAEPLGLIQLVISYNDENGGFTGHAEDNGGEFRVTGRAGGESTFDITFTKSYNSSSGSSDPNFLCFGMIDSNSGTISGTWGPTRNDTRGTFQFGRTPASILRFRYSGANFKLNRASARWSFACNAVRYAVRRQLSTWEFFKSRFREQHRFVELFSRAELFRSTTSCYLPLNQDELGELARLQNVLHPSDRRFYRSIAQAYVYRLSHHPIDCDACSRRILGSRIICLYCLSPRTADSVNLCTGCIDVTLTKKKFVHNPDHPLVKVEQIIHESQKRRFIQTANFVLSRTSAIFDSIAGSSNAVLGSPTEAVTQPRCSDCGENVLRPCWVTISNDNSTYTCMKCYEKTRPRRCNISGRHQPSLRLPATTSMPKDTNRSIEDRLTEVENNQRHIYARLDSLEQRFVDHERIIQNWFTRIESLILGKQ